MRIQYLLTACLLSAIPAAGIAAYHDTPEPISYFLPEGAYCLSESIPTPESYLGFQIGQQHADWGQVVGYMKLLADKSPRVTVRETGRTYQHRPFIEVVITSEQNQKNISAIKKEHLDISESGNLSDSDAERIPAVASLIYSIHGNEPSGVNASLPVAYFLAAAEGPEIQKILDNVVVVMTPGANPDGINRFASWVNSSRSFPDAVDLNSREFTEPWPSSRTNHYWADCNRDWLMVQHPEGINGVTTYLDWLPNIVIDHHEQGSARPYYMSPGHPKRTHRLTSQLNQDLTKQISGYVAQKLDSIGTLYYSKEGYDDYYYGKGAAYGDIHGSVCLLYEQGTTRGHHRPTINGPRKFAWTVRNQSLASFSSLLAAADMKSVLNRYMNDFYSEAGSRGDKESVKGYIVDTRGSRGVAYHFLENMSRHGIDVYHLGKDTSAGKSRFLAENAFVIPVNQKNSTMVKAVMENFTEFDDSTFYDISAWTFPSAFNLQCEPMSSVKGLLGDKISGFTLEPGKVIGDKSEQGYIFENTEFYTPKLIYELQKRGLCLSVSRKPFTFHNRETEKQMGYGTILVATKNQTISPDSIFTLLSTLAAETGVDVYSASTSLMADVDLGSPAYRPITEPRVAILTGRSMGIPDSGEAWFLMNQRFGISPTLIESQVLTAKKLNPYNVIIIANGEPDLTDKSTAALKNWVADGGTLIATGKAWKWVSDNGLMNIKSKLPKSDNTENKEKKEKQKTLYRNFEDKTADNAGKSIAGVILECYLDKTHPIAWGLDQDKIHVMKKGNIILEKDDDPYVSPLHYTSSPVVSGFISHDNKKLIADTPAAFVKPYKSGNVIVFIDDLNFRSYWFGGSKIFMNSIFFKDCL